MNNLAPTTSKSRSSEETYGLWQELAKTANFAWLSGLVNHLSPAAVCCLEEGHLLPSKEKTEFEPDLPENPQGFVQRTALYLFTGMMLHLAFSSPLNFALNYPVRWWQGLAVLASSVLAGWIFDPLVRRKIPTEITGLLFMFVNSMLFVFFGALPDTLRHQCSIERLAQLIYFSLIFGPFGCLICVHLVLPICCGAMYLAGRLVDDPRGGKGAPFVREKPVV